MGLLEKKKALRLAEMMRYEREESMMEQKEYEEIRKIIADDAKADAVIAVIRRSEQQRKQETHQKQAEGIAAAKARGVQFGRPKMQFPKDFVRVYALYKEKTVTASRSAEILGINRNSFRELVRRYEENGNQIS